MQRGDGGALAQEVGIPCSLIIAAIPPLATIRCARHMLAANMSSGLRAQIAQADRINLPTTTTSDKASLTSNSIRHTVTLRNAPPFNYAHDLTRGVLHAVQVAVQFLFMLIVM